MAVTKVRPTPAEELSERTFRMLAETLPHMVWGARPDGLQDFCNRRYQEYAGLSCEELCANGWQAIVHPEDAGRCRAAWSSAIADGSRYEVEYRLRRHDGVYRWHAGTAEPVRENGRIVRWFGTCTDIDDQKLLTQRLESLVASRTEALRASESRLREMIGNEPECVKLLDREGRLLEMNSAGLRMIDANDIDQVRGHPVYDIVAPEYRDAFRELTERVCRGGRGTLEFEIISLRGKRRWLETHAGPFRDEARGETVLLGVTRDVTEQRRAEQALAESEARFRSLAGLSSDWYWEQDENLRFVEVSPQIETAVGLFARDDVGKARWELPTRGVSPAQWAEHRRMLEARLPFRDFEYRRLNAGGQEVWMCISGEPIFDERGRFRGYRGVGRNITERKRAAEALAESEQRFRLFMDNSPALAWTKDAQLRYTWVNQKFEQVRGKTLAETVGRDDFELRSVEIAGRNRSQEEETLRLQRPMEYINKMTGIDGSEATLLVIRFPLPSGIAGIAFDITERVELERALVENQARIENATKTVRELMMRLVHAQEAERRKLAEGLHDLIGQKLSALGINLEFVRQKIPQAGITAIAPRLHQMSTLLEETIGAVREVMSDLRPQVLDEHGLSAALFQHAAAFEARTGLRVQVVGAERRLPLPHDVAIALFRIAQEALTNAAKHSGASRVLVRVRKDPARVELEVEDDGRGLSGAPASGDGWGLRMMRERAEAVGGTLKLEGANPGTRVAVSVLLGNAD